MPGNSHQEEIVSALEEETALLRQTLLGRSVPDFSTHDEDESELIEFCKYLASVREILQCFASGNLDSDIQVRGAFGGYLKTLQAHLRHLTWQVEQVANGDFSQRVDFMGSFSSAFNSMVLQLEQSINEVKERESRLILLTAELQDEIELRRKTERELHQSEQRWNLAVRCSRDGIWDINLKTGEIWYSERLLEMFGYEPDTSPSGLYWHKLIHPDNAEEGEFLRRMLSGESPLLDFTLECQVQRTDQKYLWVRIRGMTVKEEGEAQASRMVGVTSDISLQKETEKNLAFRAMHDNLTGLPNRYLLEDRLKQHVANAIRNDDSFIFVALDLDYFKTVNDTWGHTAGDTLLVEFGKKIRENLRNTDTVARLGGDEFIFVYTCEKGKEEEHTAHIMDRLYKSFAVPVMFGDVSYTISSSMGISFFPKHTNEIDELFEKADEALYCSKRKGKNTYTIWTENAVE